MKEPLWIDREDALALHDMMLAQHGGRSGVRDLGLLDSALHRSRDLFDYKKPSLFDLAGAYAYGIIQNHPFIDGNKRTGFLLAATFLAVNGVELFASEIDVVISTVALAEKRITEIQYAAWLKRDSRKR